jgi:hypothetical protein
MELAQVREFFGKYVYLYAGSQNYYGTLSAGDEPKNDIVVLKSQTINVFLYSPDIEIAVSDITSICEAGLQYFYPYANLDWGALTYQGAQQHLTCYQPYVYKAQLTSASDVINVPQQLYTINNNYNGTAYASQNLAAQTINNDLGLNMLASRQAISGDITIPSSHPIQSINGDTAVGTCFNYAAIDALNSNK